MKGVVLAGGTGSRLNPLTRITNKHLLPVYDRPMVCYAIECLVKAGITEIVLVVGGSYAGEFLRLLGDGSAHGVKKLYYAYQESADGIAAALSLAKGFTGDDDIAVILADNIFECSLRSVIEYHKNEESQARVVLTRIKDPKHLSHLGVARLDSSEMWLTGIEEKPVNPSSNLAITGFYLYTPEVFNIISTLRPSKRGELEITDVNNEFIRRGTMSHSILSGYWGDLGESIDSYYTGVDFVRENAINK